jgi:hypothetical protein
MGWNNPAPPRLFKKPFKGLAKSQKNCIPSWVDEDDKLNLLDPVKVNATRIFVGTFTVFGDQDCDVACEDFLTKKEYYSFGEEVTLPKEAWETLSDEEVFYNHGEEDVDMSSGDRSVPHVFLTKGRIGGKVYSQCPRWAKKKEGHV